MNLGAFRHGRFEPVFPLITPVRDQRRSKRSAELVAKAHMQYGGVFRRLADWPSERSRISDARRGPGRHADQLRRYGGATGLRDLTLLHSAIAMPETIYSGEYLHGSVFEMAAAHLFHLARHHPFVDGNERTVLMCALVFLGLNGQRLDADPNELYEIVDGVASGTADKAHVAVFLRDHASPR